MTEQQLVERIRRYLPVHGRGVVLSIGDDCAIFRPQGSREDLLFTSDQSIQDVHFRAGTSARRIGARAIARALSDIAAMGGDPRFCLISVSMPARFDLISFYRGVRSVADRYRLTVAGGDLARTKRVACDVVVCGSVSRGAALRRDRARPGNVVYVSGPLGANAASGYKLQPEPRIALGRRLLGRATGCMDISDGLVIDLARLCQASGVGAELAGVPVADGATLDQATNGGEDYELLYTGPPNLPGIPIGFISESPHGIVTFPNSELTRGGWDHFANES